jgi:hypothetical protein
MGGDLRRYAHQLCSRFRIVDVDGFLERIDSRQLSEWMAYDRIEPPDLWASTSTRLLYHLVCLWSSGKPPRFAEFLPPRPSPPMDEDAILAAFGIRP